MHATQLRKFRVLYSASRPRPATHTRAWPGCRSAGRRCGARVAFRRGGSRLRSERAEIAARREVAGRNEAPVDAQQRGVAGFDVGLDHLALFDSDAFALEELLVELLVEAAA